MLTRLILAFHAGVATSVGALILSLDISAPARAGALIAGLGPLLLGVRGLNRSSRYTRQWLSIAMVCYIGIGLAETIASQGHTLPALLLLSSTGEFLLLLRALRPPPSTESRESAES